MKKLWVKFRLAFKGYWEKGITPLTIFIISVLTLIYGYIAFDDEIKKGWTGHDSFENALTDISVFVPLCSALVAVIIGIIDIFMSISGSAQEKYNVEDLKAEGIAQGKSEGEAEAFRKIVGWYRRKIVAKAQGKPFTEKPPKKE